MGAYWLVKQLIKYKRKSKEELLNYCKVYFESKELEEKQYNELVNTITTTYTDHLNVA